MRHLRKLHLALLGGLVACAQVPKSHEHQATSERAHAPRSIAAIDEIMAMQSIDEKVSALTEEIYFSYLLGQSYLEEFDKLLDTDPSQAMKSETYGALLAIRNVVDKHEHELEEIQLGLNLLENEKDSKTNKKLAGHALSKVENFLKGTRVDSSIIPENLQHLVLSNLRQRTDDIYAQISDSIDLHQNDYIKGAKDSVSKKFDGLKVDKSKSVEKLKQYKVDSRVVEEALRAERKRSAFKAFEAQIERQAEVMKDVISEVGRDTSGAGIAPSTGPNGNISGSKYPDNTWSLTFDDGPGRTTEQLVTNLLERKIPATFFMLAKQATTFPKTVNRIKAEGFDIACHSYTHAQLTKVNPTQLEREIGAAKKTIENETGKPIKLFRLPYGAGVSVSRVRAKIAEHNMIHVFWTVDTLDWQDKNPTSILNRALKQMNASSKNAGIILFHDIHPQSVAASTMLMDHFNSKKMSVCTVQGVVDQMNNDLPSCK